MVTYKHHRSSERIRNRMHQPAYGPPAPYRFQRDPVRRDLRDPGPGRNPKYLEQRGGRTTYQQFRRGSSVPTVRQASPLDYVHDPLGPSEEMQRYRHYRQMVRLGLLARRLNPLMSTLDVAFQLAYELNWDNPFARWTSDEPGGYAPPPGSQVCCKIGDRASGVVIQGTSSSKCPPTGTFCGLSGQVPMAVNGAPITWTGAGRYLKVFLGPAWQVSPLSWRMSYDQIFQLDRGPSPRPPTPIPIVQGKPGVRLPVYPLAPPLPVMTETLTPPPHYEVSPRQPGPGLKPYQLPSVDVRINPGARKPPGHVPPRDGVHDRVPPDKWRLEKEKKYNFKDKSKIGKFLYGLYDKTTEADEIVDILYDNLPKDKRCRGARDMSSKAYCIWQNLEHLDIGKSIEDLIINHAEDKAWGKFYGYGKKSPFGSQLPGGTQPQIQLSQRI